MSARNPPITKRRSMAAAATVDRSRRTLIQVAMALGGGALLGFDRFAAATSSTTHSGAHRMAYASHTVEKIQFTSAGESVVGLLCLPAGANVKRPAVVVLGPFGFVKEQSPAEYATRLARAGVAALIFDPRYSGESGGTPRRHESPAAKIADVRAAIDFLSARSEVDPGRIGAVGICQGCSEMIAVATAEPRLKALALISGQYLYPANIEKFFSGGGPSRAQRIARGRQARALFDATGQVDYTEVVSLTDRSAGLPWPPIHDWYMPWTSAKWGVPSRWENRYTTMSDAEVWTFDVDDHARKLHTPTVIVHGEQSDGGPEAAQHVYDLIPARDKRLHIVPGIFHTRFYDDPLVIEPAAAEVADWFVEHLRQSLSGSKS